MGCFVTSTPAKMAAVSEMPGNRSASVSGGKWFRCRLMWSFSGPTPRPSRISMVMLRDTTSRDARSSAVGAYLQSHSTHSGKKNVALMQAKCLTASRIITHATESNVIWDQCAAMHAAADNGGGETGETERTSP